MCAAILLYVMSLEGHLEKGDWLSLGLKTSLNVTLLQTWFPHSSINQSLNGVSWFLSVTAFLYFIFPWMKKRIERASIKRIIAVLLVFSIVEMLITYNALRVLGFDSPVYTWIRYYFPVFRLVDFYAGCSMFRIISNVKVVNRLRKRNVLLELLVCFAMTYFLFLLKGVKSQSLFVINLQNSSIPIIGLACIWVMIFFINDGYLPRFVDNWVLQRMGDISGYFFLIHYVVIRMCSQIVGSIDINLNSNLKCLIFVIEFTLSFVFTELYVKKRRWKFE